MTAQSALEKALPARERALCSDSAIHDSNFSCCAIASLTNSESSPCSMTLRLYSARRLSGVLSISASQASRGILMKFGRNAVEGQDHAGIVHIFIDEFVVEPHAVAQKR